MKTYIAVVSSEAGKIAKYQDFDTQAEADAHVVMFGGFVAAKPSDKTGYWVVGVDTLTHDSTTEAADAATFASTQYQRDRDYGPIGDQLDMIYRDQVNGTTEFKAHVAAVKSAHPKPV
jgi:hypothetical protein